MAALAVVFAHAVLLSDVPVPAGSKPWAGLFTLAVPMFFALSAFSLAYRYDGQLKRYEQIKEYAIRRFFRIAPLFYFMLALWVGRAVYKWGVAGMPPTDALAANLTFTFALWQKYSTSIVSAGWSLGVEMAFYALFPLILFGVRSLAAALLATAVALVIGYLAIPHIDRSVLWLNGLVNAANFGFGLSAYFAYKRLRGFSPHAQRTAGCVSFAIAVAIWVAAYFAPTLFGPHGSFGWRYFISAAFPFFIMSGALMNWSFVTNNLSICMGRWSYSIYLLHPFILTFVTDEARRSIYAEMAGSNIWLPFVAALSVIYCVVIVSSFASYHLIELPFENIGKRLSRSSRSVVSPAE